MRRILDIELNQVQQRIFNTSGERCFVFSVSDGAKKHLLTEGTDMKYGARHLKRAIERCLVHPMSNLLASDQVHGGDWIRVDYDVEHATMTFVKEAEGLPVHAMAEIVDTSITMPASAAVGVAFDITQTRSARSSRRS